MIFFSKGFILRSEERADDIYAALDTAVEKMQRQMQRYKGKRNRGRGDGKSAAEVAPIVVDEKISDEEQPVIVRRKHFVLTPMDEQEAIEQAERFISHAGDCLWLAGPHVEQASEEQNMRLLGFPLLPGFESC